MQAGHVHMDELYRYLSPPDEELSQCAKRAGELVAAEGRHKGRWTKAPTVPITVAARPAAPAPVPSVSAGLELDMSQLVDQLAGAMPENSQKLMLVQVRGARAAGGRGGGSSYWKSPATPQVNSTGSAQPGEACAR